MRTHLRSIAGRTPEYHNSLAAAAIHSSIAICGGITSRQRVPQFCWRKSHDLALSVGSRDFERFDNGKMKGLSPWLHKRLAVRRRRKLSGQSSLSTCARIAFVVRSIQPF